MERPAVLQCRQCRTIVGDSLAMIGSNSEENAISLSSACNVVISDDFTTSKSGADVGCTYRPVICEESTCQSVLGKVYVTTTRKFDPFRDAFTFDVTRLVSYVVGSAPLNVALDQTQVPRAMAPVVLSNGAVTIADVVSASERVDALKIAMTRVQQYLLVVDERLDALDRACGIDEAISAQGDVTAGGSVGDKRPTEVNSEVPTSGKKSRLHHSKRS